MFQPSFDDIKVICDQIAKAEGYGTPGAIPTDAHNPGDLMLGNRFNVSTKHDGRLYIGLINGITVYPKADRNTSLMDALDGYAALWREVFAIYNGKSIFYHRGMTIQQIADLWTKTDPSAWAKNVADGLGADVNTRMSDLKIITV